jgi:hypothetical protein
MKKRSLIIVALIAACSLIATTDSIAAATDSAHAWTGVWQMTSPGKPGGAITLADDGGSLTGVIVFNVLSRETGQRIAIETRTMVNPHVQGNALVFQVRQILKPHLKGDPPASENASDPADIVEMKITPDTDGKAILTCSKCGSSAPMELVKQQ